MGPFPNSSQQFQTASISTNNAKFPYLEKDKYEIWAMKMEYWIQNADHNLWRIIQQGNSPKRLGKDAKEIQLIKEDEEDHAQTAVYRILWKGLHKGYDRFQKILSQLNQVQARPDNDDINLKFLRALPSSWSQVALALKTRGGLESMSFDDLYNKLRSLELDVENGQAGEMHTVPPSITGTYMPSPYKSNIEETHVMTILQTQIPMHPVIQASKDQDQRHPTCLLISRLLPESDVEDPNSDWQVLMGSDPAASKKQIQQSILPAVENQTY
ncbi:hypothetical protein Tco_1147157 [Tanacetum coccineum]